jgi:uncharacterized cupin superfamily protein
VAEEARLEPSESGLVPVTEGWFVVNARNAGWMTHDTFGAECTFEGGVRFEELGIGLCVLMPGRPNGFYHGEAAQEDFLVLSGECLLLVEGEERRLGPWDFVHCVPDTEHIFVGAGDGPCVILMAGSRKPGRAIHYPVSELALRHGAGVEEEKPNPREAYASYPRHRRERPACWDSLPWDVTDVFVGFPAVPVCLLKGPHSPLLERERQAVEALRHA